MAITSTNEFNVGASPSETMKRKLAYLAATGSESLTSGFKKLSGISGPVGNDAEPSDDFAAMMMQVASEEMRRFEERLAELEEASLAALLENEEKLREAQEELERIRERALLITMPDGRKVRVYRDGDVVRDEDGNVIDFLVPDDLPEGSPDYAELKDAYERINDLVEERQGIQEYRDRVADAESQDQLGALLDDMPPSVAAHTASAAENDQTSEPLAEQPNDNPLVATVRPARHFATAALEITADDFANLPEPGLPEDLAPPSPPDVSAPAPR